MGKIKTAIRIVKTYKNWPAYFSDYYKISKRNGVVYKLRNGIKYKARPWTSDRTIINETWVHKIYTPKNFEIKENDVVVDIGAHIGFFSIFASTLARNGKVFSFEPMPENFMLLSENIAMNNIRNIAAFNQAVGAKDGKQEIFLSEHNTGGHSFFHTKKNSEKTITVPVVSLKSFMKSHNLNAIDFLKMDCEGAEYQILFNLSRETLQKIKKISMEFHNIDDKNNAEALKTYLEKNGFKVMLQNDSRRMLYAYR